MMAEQLLPCPGCGGEPFVDHPQDEHRYLECNECTFRARDRDWQRRKPGPATKTIFDLINGCLDVAGIAEIHIDELTARAFHAEWSDPATSPAPEQPASSPWKCCVCGKPVLIANDLRPWHADGPANHLAELSDADMKLIANELRLSD